MTPFRKITIKSKAGLVLINYSHASGQPPLFWISWDPEQWWLSGSSWSRQRKTPAAQKISEIYPHRSWLGNWLWALIVKIQGYCYLNYRGYLQKLYSLDTWCLTEQTNVLRSDTTSNRINHTAYYIWPTMLHISCALINSSTLKTSKYFNKLVGPRSFQNPARNIIYTIGCSD